MSAFYNNENPVITGCAILLLIPMFIALAIWAYPNSEEKKPETTSAAAVETTQVVFDLPSLREKNIDEIRTVLGKPTDGFLTDPNKEQLAGAKYWSNTFEKDGYDLLVTFNVKDRSVSDFFVATNDPSGLTKNPEALKTVLNITGSDQFDIEFVKAQREPSQYTGLIATPKK